MVKQLSKSKIVAQKTIFAAFKILKENGGQLSGREIIDKIRVIVPFDEWEMERLEKTGNIRWESIFHFYSIDSIKAGFLRKNNGVWILTDEGESAMKLGPEKLLETTSAAYKKWKLSQETIRPSELEQETGETQSQEATLSKYEAEALDGIKNIFAH